MLKSIPKGVQVDTKFVANRKSSSEKAASAMDAFNKGLHYQEGSLSVFPSTNGAIAYSYGVPIACRKFADVHLCRIEVDSKTTYKHIHAVTGMSVTVKNKLRHLDGRLWDGEAVQVRNSAGYILPIKVEE